MSEISKEDTHGGVKSQANNDVGDTELKTPCPLCGNIGVYKKFLRFDLRNHLNKEHPKWELAAFVTGEAHFSRWWNIDEQTCKQKWSKRTRDLWIEVLKDLIEFESGN